MVETCSHRITRRMSININPLNAELNPIRHLLALVGARHIVHVSRVRVNKVMQMYHLLLQTTQLCAQH